MFLSITSRTYDFVSNNMPSLQLASPSQMARNVALVALPTIALVASSQMLSVDAGPMSCAVCYTACLAATWGGFAPMCVATCTPICVGPFP